MMLSKDPKAEGGSSGCQDGSGAEGSGTEYASTSPSSVVPPLSPDTSSESSATQLPYQQMFWPLSLLSEATAENSFSFPSSNEGQIKEERDFCCEERDPFSCTESFALPPGRPGTPDKEDDDPRKDHKDQRLKDASSSSPPPQLITLRPRASGGSMTSLSPERFHASGGVYLWPVLSAVNES